MKTLYPSHIASIVYSLSLLLFALESSSYATLRYVGVLLTPDGSGRYSVVEIGDNLNPHGINNDGAVVGTVFNQVHQGFVWTQAEGLEFLTPCGTTLRTTARSINNKGQIAGACYDENQLPSAAVWDSAKDVVTLDAGGSGTMPIR